MCGGKLRGAGGGGVVGARGHSLHTKWPDSGWCAFELRCVLEEQVCLCSSVTASEPVQRSQNGRKTHAEKERGKKNTKTLEIRDPQQGIRLRNYSMIFHRGLFSFEHICQVDLLCRQTRRMRDGRGTIFAVSIDLILLRNKNKVTQSCV